jgi:AbrB family looped-hinge helix DNA binding protein
MYDGMATTRLSSKRQITVPVKMARALGLEPGDRIILRLEGDHIVLIPAPDSLADTMAGSLEGRYGDVERYIREERGSWGE